MKLEKVQDDRTRKWFVEGPVAFYRSDPNYIRPLDQDIHKIFDPEKNKYFKHGRAERWILWDQNQNFIGRIAAFVNDRNKDAFDQPTGGIGFFESINNPTAAHLLFDQAKQWLSEQGMEAMDGPINFGERNMWWGLLVDGFSPPSYGMNYNPPYYQALFESYGFQLYYNQYSYGLRMNDPRPEKYYDRSRELMQDANFHFKHFQAHQLESFAEDFMYIFNHAFASREGVKELRKDNAIQLIKSLKPILVDYLLWFGYYKEEPIAFFLMLPEINQIIKHVDGQMNWWGKLKFFYHQQTGTCRKVFGFLFGVIPAYQGRGVEGAIIIAANNVVQPKKRWDDIELTWIGDFNPKMMRVAENLGAHIEKTHITYRYLFDRSKPFHRKAVEQS